MFEYVSLLIAVYGISILFLRRSGNDKKKDIAGWLLFGLMWPQIRPAIEKDPEHREAIFVGMLVTFMIAAVVLLYVVTGSKLL